ncbi:hypothetical protein CEP54_014509 [Fusarium duplospermum]|uniref:Uncharacterized protein n=1 Tax=Fusarium duplospermum TaxID=1325734 RepID=A0A428NVZ1_9HYPO|nr:hypothetical protein CEP54_014509 [Fusarium duplospermum]
MRVSVQGPLGRAGQSQKSPAVSVTIQRPSSTPNTVDDQPSSGAASAVASHEPIGSNAGVPVIEFYKALGVLLCLRCPAAIKPSRDQVESHHRKKRSLVGQRLKDVLAFAESSHLACVAEAAERRSKVDVPGGAGAESNWVRFMQSAKHLQGKDKRAIRLAAAAPVSTSMEKRQWNGDGARQNQRLRILAASFTCQVDRCIGRMDRVPTETLMWLSGKESTKPGRRPFSIKETSSTMDFYSKCWQRYLCYCARMFGLGRDAARANNDIVFTDDQWNKLWPSRSAT